MKHYIKSQKADIANQTISAILMFLDDQISLTEFNRLNRKMQRTIKPRISMPIKLTNNAMARQFC